MNAKKILLLVALTGIALFFLPWGFALADPATTTTTTIGVGGGIGLGVDAQEIDPDSRLSGGFGFEGFFVEDFIRNVLGSGMIIVSGLAVIKIIFAGILYATAAGNQNRITSAKEHIYYALIGVLLLVGMNILLVLIGATPF